MWNPFKHNEEHNDITDSLVALAVAILDLQDSVRELREEVDYLVDFLDD
jgi:divalent metal cation (Fe/Co/Zn/Cd) transporter